MRPLEFLRMRHQIDVHLTGNEVNALRPGVRRVVVLSITRTSYISGTAPSS